MKTIFISSKEDEFEALFQEAVNSKFADVVVRLAEELQKRDKNILKTLGVREEIKVYRKNIFDEYKYCEIDDF